MFLLYDSAEKFFISSKCTPNPGGLLKSHDRLPSAYLCQAQATSSQPIEMAPTLGPVQLGRIPTVSVARHLDSIEWLQLTNEL
ncbi:hypothetical protein DPMN_146257 [Dreissena polymorpha]|uniref:Uncharacterized protein n=1 Tax=Dreissena polymorpha TaxID=45954 RepID=A0A9D4F6B2_DREPO|nr:hypothetical protein DPMN_146257 [Dreissena polymorpha]